jgi:xylan 1,4-beta-xylosidase
VWQKMNSPLEPTAEQFAELENAGKLAEMNSQKNLRVKNCDAILRINLPRQAVSLIVIDWK